MSLSSKSLPVSFVFSSHPAECSREVVGTSPASVKELWKAGISKCGSEYTSAYTDIKKLQKGTILFLSEKCL